MDTTPQVGSSSVEGEGSASERQSSTCGCRVGGVGVYVCVTKPLAGRGIVFENLVVSTGFVVGFVVEIYSSVVLDLGEVERCDVSGIVGPLGDVG